MSIGLNRRLLVLLPLAGCAAAGPEPNVPPAAIVALGASNTEGFRVARSESFPAQLQAMLRAEGRNVSVLNAGISGDTSANMLRRLDAAVPAGTRVVLLQPGGNDRRAGDNGTENVDAIRQRLRARNIHVIMVTNQMLGALPQGMRQADGIHFTPEGYRILAQRLLPQVNDALDARS